MDGCNPVKNSDGSLLLCSNNNNNNSSIVVDIWDRYVRVGGAEASWITACSNQIGPQVVGKKAKTKQTGTKHCRNFDKMRLPSPPFLFFWATGLDLIGLLTSSSFASWGAKKKKRKNTRTEKKKICSFDVHGGHFE